MFLFLTACSGQVHDLGETRSGVTPGDDAAAPPNAPVSAALATAKAHCASDEHGPTDFEALKDVRNALIGKWLVCSSGPHNLFGGEGIEFHPNGRWNRLRIADDELVPSLGIGNEGVFAEDPHNDEGTILASTGNTTQGAAPTSVAFETSPRRMRTLEYGFPGPSWLVRLDP
ncbi:MAG TPA: hypothetical protein VM925_07545 [Labilithrix sp.]|nr:hypothetical protein [Labilithrix sp.]